jgi:hypothetical protein
VTYRLALIKNWEFHKNTCLLKKWYVNRTLQNDKCPDEKPRQMDGMIIGQAKYL